MSVKQMADGSERVYCDYCEGQPRWYAYTVEDALAAFTAGWQAQKDDNGNWLRLCPSCVAAGMLVIEQINADAQKLIDDGISVTVVSRK